jgi:hypothetical protein
LLYLKLLLEEYTSASQLGSETYSGFFAELAAHNFE